MNKKHKTHAKRHRNHSSEEGFLGADIKKIMSRNEKLVLGLLIGGIIIFLILSIVLLVGRMRDRGPEGPLVTPTTNPNLTPYPTDPPMNHKSLIVNEEAFSPERIVIEKGNFVIILNVGQSSVTIEGTNPQSALFNYTLEPFEQRDVKVDNPGTYEIRNVANDQTATIVVQ